MIRFHKLAIEGFRSFGEDQVFTFPSTAGFYLVSGENKVEKELGANGAGKSGLLESISWVLYGKTSRGLKGKDVANRTGEFLTSVCLEFYIDSTLYAVTRTWNPNSLVLDAPGQKPKLIEQEELEALIGCTYSQFLRTVLFGQFQTFFLEESPSQKIAILADILELEVWDEAATRAKELVKKIAGRVEKQSLAMATMKGQAESIEANMVRLSDLSLTFEVERGEKKTYLQADLAATKEQLREATKKLESCKEDLATLEEKASKRKTRLDVTSASRRKSIELVSEISKGIAVLSERLANVNSRSSSISPEDSTCPICLQPINKRHRKQMDATYEEEKASIKNEIRRLRIQEEAAVIKQSEQTATEKELQRDITLFASAKNELEVTAAKTRTKQAVLKEALSRVEKELSSVESSANKYAEEFQKAKAALNEWKGKIESANASIIGLNNDKAKAEYWSDKFKEIRLWVVEQALTELELHVNNAIEDLGLSNYKITFDIERQKSDKSGVIKGFQTFISQKGKPDPIPWESWSGGETQRLCLAGTIGLADLISARRGFNCDTEIWDEPTAGLSEEGIDDLLLLLGGRAKTRNKLVWLVDHRSLNAGDFDGNIHVVKDETGSHILQHQPKTEVIKTSKKKERAAT